MTRPRRIRVALVVSVAALACVSSMGAAGPSPHPQIPVGEYPTGIAIDPVSRTVYVANGTSGTLSVIDGQRCHARVAGRCPAARSFRFGIDPVGIGVLQSRHTLYIVDSAKGVSLIDSRTCRAGDLTGCRTVAATVSVGSDPQFLQVDESTQTIYVANVRSNTISVIDGARCNVTVTRGCRHVRATITTALGPFTFSVDPATDSMYVAHLFEPTVSLIDMSTCNARVITGCRKRPITIAVGDVPGGIAFAESLDTVFVSGQMSSDVSLIDTRSCNARETTGCSRKVGRVPSGLGARGVSFDPATETVYVVNTGADSVTVIDGSTCNARVRSGCRNRATTPVGISPRRAVADPRTGTVYVTNAASNTVSMIDTHRCNGRHPAGCPKLKASAPVA